MKTPKNCIGRELNKPFKSGRKGKKRQVCVKEGDKIYNPHYGAKGYSDFTIHKDEERRKRFRARHKCSKKKDKTKAGYWACKDLW